MQPGLRVKHFLSWWPQITLAPTDGFLDTVVPPEITARQAHLPSESDLGGAALSARLALRYTNPNGVATSLYIYPTYAPGAGEADTGDHTCSSPSNVFAFAAGGSSTYLMIFLPGDDYSTPAGGAIGRCMLPLDGGFGQRLYYSASTATDTVTIINSSFSYLIV